jgi:hypothetical protein
MYTSEFVIADRRRNLHLPLMSVKRYYGIDLVPFHIYPPDAECHTQNPTQTIDPVCFPTLPGSNIVGYHNNILLVCLTRTPETIQQES